VASPSIILTSAFTLPQANTFAGFLGYMNRANALSKKPDRSPLEDIELTLINTKMFENAGTELEIGPDPSNDLAQEAQAMINTQKEQHERYLRYMTRTRALLQAPDFDESSEREIERMARRLNEDGLKDESGKHYYGTFTADDHNISEKTLKDISGNFARGQEHGSVLFEDVVSFDTSFLEKLGIYNHKTNVLKEEALVKAGRQMMQSMSDSEGMKDVTWMASIHRNTEHIHIHFASVESVNTRPLMVSEADDGSELIAPRGKRKQATLDHMKSEFARTLVDRVKERERVSDLRNGLIKDVRETLSTQNSVSHDIARLYLSLPKDRRRWNYAMIHGDQKQSLDSIVSTLMADNSQYKEYQDAVNQSAAVDRELYGKTERVTKDYARNQMADINKRLGNQVLNYCKNLKPSAAKGIEQLSFAADQVDGAKFDDDFVELLAQRLQEVQPTTSEAERIRDPTSQESTSSEERQRFRQREQQQRIRREETTRPLNVESAVRHDVSLIKRSLSDYMTKDRYAAMREYEKAQRLSDRTR
jgi:hypothetical protein